MELSPKQFSAVNLKPNQRPQKLPVPIRNSYKNLEQFLEYRLKQQKLMELDGFSRAE
jgi:hypothetical protein